MTTSPVPGSGLPGPERIAGGLTVLVVLAVALAMLGPSVVSRTGAPSPSPSITGAPTPRATHAVDATAVAVVRAVNRRLAEAQLQLAPLLDPVSLDVPTVQLILRGMNPQLLLGLDATSRLQSRDLSRAAGTRLGQLYTDLRSAIAATLEASVRNEAAYRAGATRILALLVDLPGLDQEVAALLEATAPPSTAPTPSAPPTPTPSAPPTPTPVATASPSPSAPTPPLPSPSPSPSVAPAPNAVANGGFEGSLEPWRIETAAGATATGSLDPVNPGEGMTSLRVVITAGSPSRQGIAVRQDGVRLTARTHYRLAIRARSEAARDLRLSVTSASGAAYASTLGAIGPVWTTVRLDFLAIAGDDDAVIAIDLGQGTETTWLDDVELTRVGP